MRLRWWPGQIIFTLTVLAVAGDYLWPNTAFQMRNIVAFGLVCVGLLFGAVWWLGFSRAPWPLRRRPVLVLLALAGLGAATLRFRGVTGDFVPIFEPRWVREVVVVPPPAEKAADLDHSGRPDFPQYLGPQRNAVLTGGPALARDWTKQPPQVLWRQPIGIGWSGFAIVGQRAVTMEQRGDEETVTCLDVRTGRQLWAHGDPVRFESSFGGHGPRSTPTIVDGRVFTYGATGRLNCLSLATGEKIWQRDVYATANGGRPEWGYAGSPLVLGDQVIVSAGKSHDRSLWSFAVKDGEVVWHDGSQPASYSSPMLATLAGTPQILMFNMIAITAHDPATGAVLWEYPWGIRQPHVAQPLPVAPDRVVFSSGYGVGSELLQIARGADGKLAAARLWKTTTFRAKMASFIARDTFLYGLDDGIFACIDWRDGSRRWKEGRYGHGQLLAVDDLVLVTAENGEIVLLAPTPEAPHELTRFRVFAGKTWNPPALSGDLLLMRTDEEATCLRLPTVGTVP